MGKRKDNARVVVTEEWRRKAALALEKQEEHAAFITALQEWINTVATDDQQMQFETFLLKYEAELQDKRDRS